MTAIHYATTDLAGFARTQLQIALAAIQTGNLADAERHVMAAQHALPPATAGAALASFELLCARLAINEGSVSETERHVLAALFRLAPHLTTRALRAGQVVGRS